LRLFEGDGLTGQQRPVSHRRGAAARVAWPHQGHFDRGREPAQAETLDLAVYEGAVSERFISPGEPACIQASARGPGRRRNGGWIARERSGRRRHRTWNQAAGP